MSTGINTTVSYDHYYYYLLLLLLPTLPPTPTTSIYYHYWPLLSTTDCHYLLLTDIIYYWQLLSTTDSYYLLLTATMYYWPLLCTTDRCLFDWWHESSPHPQGYLLPSRWCQRLWRRRYAEEGLLLTHNSLSVCASRDHTMVSVTSQRVLRCFRYVHGKWHWVRTWVEVAIMALHMFAPQPVQRHLIPTSVNSIHYRIKNTYIYAVACMTLVFKITLNTDISFLQLEQKQPT